MQTTIENNDLAQIIQNMGDVSLYGYKSSYPKNNAQINLEGRTHWAEDKNLKFFWCRISSACETASGLLFYVIESSFLDFYKTKGGFRYAVFDVFGECVQRLDVDSAFSSSEKARKAMWAELDSFDIAKHYLNSLELKVKREERKAMQTREALAQLSATQPVEA